MEVKCQSHQCETTADSMDRFKRHIDSLSKDDSKAYLLVFKARVNENVMPTENMTFSSNYIESTSIFVSIQSTLEQKCIIYWKTKEMEGFFILKLFDDHQSDDFVDMVQEFLIAQLKRGDKGVLPMYEHRNEGETALPIIGNAEGFNLLMEASKKGKVEIVKYLLKHRVDVSLKCKDEKFAVDFACEEKHFDVIFELLQANSKFPKTESLKECQDEHVASFIEMCNDMHRAVVDRDKNKIRKIAKDNPNLRYYFNISNNKSAVIATLGCGYIDIYELLVSLNIFPSPDEDPIYNKIPRERLKNIHDTYSKTSPDNHLLTLISNSHLFIDNVDVESHYKSIREAYEILDSIPQMKCILRVVAAFVNFQIHYDFKRNSLNTMDPLSVQSSNGMFYPEGKLYLAFKDFLHPTTKFNAIGVLAHELCHFAMHLVFRNERKPYAIHDSDMENEFERISQICKNLMENENIIKLVYAGLNYNNSKYHTELIVRVPHILAHYHENPQEIYKCQTMFKELFEFFNTKMILAIEETIPVVAMISNENITYDLLTTALQAKVLDSEVTCGKIKLTLNDAQRFDKDILRKLSSRQICDILNGKMINVNVEIYLEREFIDADINDAYKKDWTENDKDYIHLDKHKSFDCLVTECQVKNQIVVVSDIPGAGKTTSFKQFQIKAQEKYKNFWVFYIDLKQHIDIYKNHHGNAKKLEDIILQFLNFTSEEKKAKFLNDFKDSKNVFFLWDGFHEIPESPEYKTFTLNVIRQVAVLEHKQWISTTPQFASELESAFSTKAYELVPFTAHQRTESLKMFFELKGLTSTQVKEKVDSIEVFLEKLKGKTDYKYLNNPFLLRSLAENLLNESLLDCNVYALYEDFIFEKIKKLRGKDELEISVNSVFQNTPAYLTSPEQNIFMSDSYCCRFVTNNFADIFKLPLCIGPRNIVLGPLFSFIENLWKKNIPSNLLTR